MRLLGDVAIQRDGREWRRLRAQKYAHLLAYLAINPHVSHSREELLEEFWPDEDPERARASLRTALSSLRSQLGPEIFMAGPREVVRLNADAITTDAAEFQALADAKDPRARDLYGGPFMPGCYLDWALDERLRLEAVFEFLPEAVSPPLPTLQPPQKKRIGLPTPVTNFYGRAEELDQIRTMLELDGRRLVTVAGLGGAGKTRLAVEAAYRIPWRVIYAPILEAQSPQSVLIALADVLALDRTPLETLEKRVKADLAQERTLLVLDNAEQTVSPEFAAWLEDLLGACPDLAILVTSRIPVQSRDETVFHLSALSPEDAQSLFLDRARNVLPDFPNTDDLELICEKLDRFPLAIELCASWANVLNPRRILEKLSQGTLLIQSSRRSIPDRHKSLNAILEWSCPPDSPHRVHLASLSVLLADWSLDAAEAILESENAAATLSELRDKSLIEGEFRDYELRFRMLESVRDFAKTWAEPDDQLKARAKHLEHFGRLATRMARLHPTHPLSAFAGLEQEHPNIYAALAFGLKGTPEQFEFGFRTLEDIGWCWWIRGYAQDHEALMEIAAQRDASDLQGPSLTFNLRVKARQELAKGDPRTAIQHLEKVCALCREMEDDDGHYRARRSIVDAYEKMKDWDGALAVLEEDLAREKPGTHLYFLILADIAGLHIHRRNDPEKALPIYEKLHDHWQSFKEDPGHLAVIELAMSACYLARGEDKEAQKYAQRAIPIFQQLGQTKREAEAWEALRKALLNQGALQEAETASAEIFRLGYLAGMPEA